MAETQNGGHASDGLVVRTDAGEVRGIIDGDVRQWRGIPFAAPPVDDLRFRAPQPVTPWVGVRDAQAFGAVPVQVRGKDDFGAGKKTPMGEDCLTINILAPLTNANKPRKVVMWFYGGAFLIGSASSTLYRGDKIVTAGDVIFVSSNYRLGALGWIDFSSWSTPEHPIERNLGLRDQVAALQWVSRNIAAFGGDPNDVTIFGESAGGTSIITLMCVPSAAGLFHRVFAMSPAPSFVYSSARHAEWAREVLKLLDVDPDNVKAANRALLVELFAEKIVEATARFALKINPKVQPGTLTASVVVDGDFLPKHPIDAFREGSAQNVPLVVGSLTREGAFFDKTFDFLPTKVDRLELMFQQTEPSARDRIAAAYPGYPSHPVAIDIGGDLVFWHPSIQVAEAHAQHGGQTWCYRFDYATPMTKWLFGGATHGFDIPMLFGKVGEGPFKPVELIGKRTSKKVGVRFQQAFLDFVHQGSPGWDPYEEEKRLTKIFNVTDRVESDPCKDRRVAWGDYRGWL